MCNAPKDVNPEGGESVSKGWGFDQGAKNVVILDFPDKSSSLARTAPQEVYIDSCIN